MTEFRQMYMSDLPKVLRIIEDTDEDDAKDAEEDFHAQGMDDHYVLELDDKVIGVTGFRAVPATDHTSWLSWTYLDTAHHGKGLGKLMTQKLLHAVKAAGGHNIFVKVSNYVDPEDGPIYARALSLYKSLGFVESLTNVDFYDEDEDQIILGLPLLENTSPELDENGNAIAVAEEKPIVRFNGLREIGESEGAYTFDWIVKERRGSFFEKRSFSVEDLQVGINSVRDKGGRKIFLTFPSNLPLIHDPLQRAGFKYAGQLQDYYEHGVHDMHFTHDLT